MRITTIFIVACIFSSNVSLAQIAVNNSGQAPHGSAMLDITSMNKGLLIPRLTTTQRNNLDATAAKGLMVYDSIVKSLYFHNGLDWIRITDDSTNQWLKSGNHISNINTGNVGIGISPQLKLDVKSTTGSGNTARFDGINQTNILIYENGLYRGYFGSVGGSAEDMDIGTGIANPSGKLHLTIQNVPKVTLDTEGDVGIGTTTPGFPLTIVSDDDEGIGMYRNTTFSGALRATDTTFKIQGRYGNGTSVTAVDLLLQPPSTLPLQSVRGNVGVFTNSPKTDFHINGDVLVGNAEPATGFKVSIDGKIAAEEIRVQLSGDWPDYVFQEDYVLKTIPQLEQFIKTNQHLPNIPSAKEMEKGQDVGEIQRKMMEKIEELTLYIIQLEKRLGMVEKK